MDLVMKDGSGGSGFAHLRPDFEKFFPTTLRITMIQVSAGSTYDPNKVPAITPTDAGATSDGRADGAADHDSATFPTGSMGGAAGSVAGGAGGIGGNGAGGVVGGAAGSTTGSGATGG